MRQMEQLATKPRAKPWTLDISREELRLKLRRRVGKSSPYRPKPGTEKSTKICIRDIALLARAHDRSIRNFVWGKPNTPGYATAGQKTLERVNKILDMVNGGYITKTQYGAYHFWDEPQVPPVVTRRINLESGRIMPGITMPKAPQRMPSFATVFKDVK